MREKKLILEYPERPEASFITIPCEHCQDVNIRIKLEWWRNMDDEYQGKYWVKDDSDHVAWQDRLCSNCLDKRLKVDEKSRELQADVPPSWFDPANAGERWDDDY